MEAAKSINAPVASRRSAVRTLSTAANALRMVGKQGEPFADYFGAHLSMCVPSCMAKLVAKLALQGVVGKYALSRTIIPIQSPALNQTKDGARGYTHGFASITEILPLGAERAGIRLSPQIVNR
jgi:hypothetical protein